MKRVYSIGVLGSKCSTPEQVAESKGPLSFDGVYTSVWDHRHVLLGRDVTLFVVGDYVGKDNSFDITSVHKEKFCDWNQIMDLVYQGAKLAWHTWTHPDLTTVKDGQLIREITPPMPMDEFAYPFGKFDKRVVDAVVKAGYKRAWATSNGDDGNYTLKRVHL